MVTIESKVEGLSEQSLARFVLRARRAAGVRGQVHVLVVGNPRMRCMNWQFRGKKRSTDVLSFPAIAEVAERFAGDIVICSDVAAANARRLDHSLAQELQILILHGLLHLRGFDHESDQGEMARLELQLRRKLGLEHGLIERTHGARRESRGGKQAVSHIALGTSHSRPRRSR